MFPSIVESRAAFAMRQLATFTERRHEVLAGNIANLDTPGYRVRDLSQSDFESKLSTLLTESQQTGQTPETLAKTDGDDAELPAEMQGILFHDDSNGSLEQQIIELAKNQARHNMAAALLSQQYRLLQTVISERA